MWGLVSLNTKLSLNNWRRTYFRLKHEVGLRKHLARHRVEVENDVVNCPICNKVLPNKKSLKNHTQYVHGEKRYQCTLCDKSFMTSTILKVNWFFFKSLFYDFHYFFLMTYSGTYCYTHRWIFIRLPLLWKEI